MGRIRADVEPNGFIFDIPTDGASDLKTFSSTGIAKLLVVNCEGLATAGSGHHFGRVIGPEADRIGSGVTI